MLLPCCSWQGVRNSLPMCPSPQSRRRPPQENSGVVVMGATNLPDTLDSALTRPGRFDRQVRSGRQRLLASCRECMRPAMSAESGRIRGPCIGRSWSRFPPVKLCHQACRRPSALHGHLIGGCRQLQSSLWLRVGFLGGGWRSEGPPGLRTERTEWSDIHCKAGKQLERPRGCTSWASCPPPCRGDIGSRLCRATPAACRPDPPHPATLVPCRLWSSCPM